MVSPKQDPQPRELWDQQEQHEDDQLRAREAAEFPDDDSNSMRGRF